MHGAYLAEYLGNRRDGLYGFGWAVAGLGMGGGCR